MTAIIDRFDSSSGKPAPFSDGGDLTVIAKANTLFAGKESTDPSLSAQDRAPVEPLSWTDRFSLYTKLRVAIASNVAILIAIALVTGAVVLFIASNGKRVADNVAIEILTSQAAMELADGASQTIPENAAEDPSALLPLSERIDVAHGYMEGLVKWMNHENYLDHQIDIDGFSDSLKQLDRAVRDPNLRANPDEIRGLLAEVDAVLGDLRQKARDMRDANSHAADELYFGVEILVVATGFLIILGIAFSLFVARRMVVSVADMIKEITLAMRRLADGDTQSAIPGRERNDEIGDMARALSVFRESSLALSELNSARAADAEKQLAHQQNLNERTAVLRKQTGQMLEKLANRFEVSVGDVIASVSSATDRLRTTSQTMATLSHGSAEQSRSATAAMESANVNVTAAAAATDEFALSINEISLQASGSAALAREASTLVDSANSQMHTLAEAAEEIGEIVELIQTIAQRTNLLALNASIEAARGGEAGRGFAVVASEVKELANQTSAATHNVGERIHAIQSSTNSSVDALTSIVAKITELEQSSGVIASAVDQQSLSGEELARNIDVAASGSADVVLILEKLKATSQATGGAVEDVLGSAGELGQLAEDMRGQAGLFIADIRKSATDLAERDCDDDEAANGALEPATTTAPVRS